LSNGCWSKNGSRITTTNIIKLKSKELVPDDARPAGHDVYQLSLSSFHTQMDDDTTKEVRLE
jgi:hypothetical protein